MFFFNFQVKIYEKELDENVSKEDLEKTRQLIDLRVNKLGVAETTVSVEGDRRIRVEIPGEYDSKELVDSLSKTGNLTFKDSEGNEIFVSDLSDEEKAEIEKENAEVNALMDDINRQEAADDINDILEQNT
mgnify:CR=1 FL=1